MTQERKTRTNTSGKPRRRRLLRLGAWGLTLTLLVTFAALVRPHFLTLVDYQIYDSFLTAETHPAHPGRPVIINIDEPSLERYGQWPWPRALVAELLQQLQALEPAAVGLDLLFPERERTRPPVDLEQAPPGQDTPTPAETSRPLTGGDRRLATALRTGPFVIGHEFSFDVHSVAPRDCVLHPLRTAWIIRDGTPMAAIEPRLHLATDIVCSIPPLAQAVSSSGFLNAAPDEDGVLRAFPLLIRFRDQLYPSLPLATYLAATGAEQVTIHAGRDGVTALDTGEGGVPVNQRGDLLLRYRGPARTFPRVSARDVLAGRVGKSEIGGRIVFVGATAYGLDETVATPLDGVLPGVEVIATVADNLLQRDFLQRPAYGRGAELLVALLVGLVATLVLSLFRPAWGAPLLAVVGVLLWQGSAWMFHTQGLFLSPLFPVAALCVTSSGMVFARYLEEARTAKTRAQGLVATQNLMLESLASLAEIRDRKVGGHQRQTQQRVRSLCEALAENSRFSAQITPLQVDVLARLAPLHDIGKVGVPDGVLMKSGKLSDAEFSMIKKHTVYGEEVIDRARARAGVQGTAGSDAEELLVLAKQVVTSHHERWDGSGYPKGLVGEDIPLAGRIVAIIDVYEALLEARAYRGPHSHDEALEIIRLGGDSQFDPIIVEVFLDVAATWKDTGAGAAATAISALAPCILAAALLGPAPAQGKTRVLDSTQVFCETELRKTQEELRALERGLSESSTPLERARLQRAHADWTRFVGTSCDAETFGTATRDCCTLRYTEQRIVDLHLQLAQRRPVDFRTWGTGIAIPEREELLAFLEARNPRMANPTLPSKFLRVGERQYLLAFPTARGVEKRMEYVNLRTGTATPLWEGIPTFLRIVRDIGEHPHVLFEVQYVDRRIRWTEFYLLTLSRSDDQLVATDRRLAVFMEDAGAGRCDEHSRRYLKLEKAVVPVGVEYRDINRDGAKDIVILGTEVQCATQEETPFSTTFLAAEEGFIPQ